MTDWLLAILGFVVVELGFALLAWVIRSDDEEWHWTFVSVNVMVVIIVTFIAMLIGGILMLARSFGWL